MDEIHGLKEQMERLTDALLNKYEDSLVVNHHLSRKLVSFQANKKEPGHRWFRFKEGFSASLVRYILKELGVKNGVVLDPFAGMGTTLFTAAELGLAGHGVELLPVCIEVVETKRLVFSLDQEEREELIHRLREFTSSRVWEKEGKTIAFPHLNITRGAFPTETEAHLERYMYETNQVNDPLLRRVLRLAAMCVLEETSYTSKDGQYLRWDARAGRGSGSFHKRSILGFTEALLAKLKQFAYDLRQIRPLRGEIRLFPGSCLEVLGGLEEGEYDLVITSPPYCNRYDYTRTYALELAFLGVGEEGVKDLRQAMLTCTVENREKRGLKRVVGEEVYNQARVAFEKQEVLQTVYSYLEACREHGLLNNDQIPRMVYNYFWEMSIVTGLLARVLKPGACLVMVNDNVRYQGVEVPVDLILSELAGSLGFVVEKIWVLPQAKGNSSQQMGAHGRQRLRKCVYIWRKS